MIVRIINYATAVQPAGLPQTPASSSALHNLLQIATYTIGALAVLFITISGLRYVLSDGDPQKMSKAKDSLIYALVGLAIAVIAESIVIFVVGKVG